MLYSFFWEISQRLNFMCRRFGTLCCANFIGRVNTAYEDGTVCSKTSAHKNQKPENHPKLRIQQDKTQFVSKIKGFQRVIIVI
jgi:hypothetical protein